MTRPLVPLLMIDKVISKTALLIRDAVMTIDAILVAVAGGLAGYHVYQRLPGGFVWCAIFLLSVLNLLALWRARGAETGR